MQELTERSGCRPMTRIAGLRSETSPDYARVSFYFYYSLDVNKDRMTL